MKKRLRILKLRFIRWLGFKFTSDERSEICYWLTRNVTKSNEETLREVNGGRCMSNQEFIESVDAHIRHLDWKYGLLVMGKNGCILHFCGFENEPTEADKKSLRSELETDISLGLTDRIDDLVIVDAPKEVVDFYLQEVRG